METRGLHIRKLLADAGLSWLGRNRTNHETVKLTPHERALQIAAEQGHTKPTDVESLRGILQGEIDDEFLDFIRQQRTPRSDQEP